MGVGVRVRPVLTVRNHLQNADVNCSFMKDNMFVKMQT